MEQDAPLSKRQGGTQGAHGRASIAEEQILHLRRNVYRGTAAHDIRLGKIIGKDNVAPQLAKGIAHIAGIIALEQVMQAGVPCGQSRNQKDSVRDALGARQVHFAIIGVQGRQLKETRAKLKIFHDLKLYIIIVTLKDYGIKWNKELRLKVSRSGFQTATTIAALSFRTCFSLWKKPPSPMPKGTGSVSGR
jgi:hypothetical protein